MDKEEIRAKLLDVVSSLIKDDADAAQSNVHDVLAAKMRDRVNPPTEVEPTEAEPTEAEPT